MLSENNKSDSVLDPDDYDISQEISMESLIAMNADIDINKIINNMNNVLNVFNETEIFEKKKISKEVEKKDYKLCPECKIPCKIHDTVIICENCGMERVWDCHSHNLYSITIDQNYNTASNSFLSFNIVGNNSYCYNRSFLKTCADYSAYRNNNNKKDIINKIYQYEGNKPPANIINAAADLFDQIKNKGYVYRGDGKLGVIGACLYYASIMNNLTRTPKEISQIMGIDERFLSHGDRVLQELNELGIITIPTNYKPLDDYLKMYMPALNIPDKYKQFIVDVIARAERKHLHIKNESRMTTKCVGCIYLLTRRVPELKHIKKDTISIECNNISKSTFIRYSTLITDNFRLMKKPFRKHGIPMPVEWM
jgi:hypothetical protein